MPMKKDTEPINDSTEGGEYLTVAFTGQGFSSSAELKDVPRHNRTLCILGRLNELRSKYTHEYI
jgi:hypothetical protein